MPQNVVRRSKVAEALALVAVCIALISSSTIFLVNQRSIDRVTASRHEVTLKNCRDQNQRHLASIAYLHKLTKQLEKKNHSPAFHKANLVALARYEFLFQALAPVRNCEAYVDRVYR